MGIWDLVQGVGYILVAIIGVIVLLLGGFAVYLIADQMRKWVKDNGRV